MTEPPQPFRPQPVNPYEGTPQPLGTWAQPPAAYAPTLPEHPEASTVLILGVLGLLVAVTGPFALVIGSRARADVAAGRYAASGALTAGWVLGIITTVYLALLVILFLLGIGALVAFRSS